MPFFSPNNPGPVRTLMVQEFDDELTDQLDSMWLVFGFLLGTLIFLPPCLGARHQSCCCPSLLLADGVRNARGRRRGREQHA